MKMMLIMIILMRRMVGEDGEVIILMMRLEEMVTTHSIDSQCEVGCLIHKVFVSVSEN